MFTELSILKLQPPLSSAQLTGYDQSMTSRYPCLADQSLLGLSFFPVPQPGLLPFENRSSAYTQGLRPHKQEGCVSASGPPEVRLSDTVQSSVAFLLQFPPFHHLTSPSSFHIRECMHTRAHMCVLYRSHR